MMSRYASAALCALLFAGPVAAAGPGVDPQVRRAAETLAKWGVEQGDFDALAAGLSALLGAGATLDPEDPWRAAEYLAALRALVLDDPGRQEVIDGLLSAPRGAFDSVSRVDAQLAEDESVSVTVRMAAHETALVEARLKGSAPDADIDLLIASEDGEILTEDSGPGTGVSGVGTLVLWTPQACQTVEVRVVNAGSGTARVTLMIPPSQAADCAPG